jgi:hypothetical protein
MEQYLSCISAVDESRPPIVDDLALIEDIGPVRKAKRDLDILLDLDKYRHDASGRLVEHDWPPLKPRLGAEPLQP